ncbi:dispanin subfamily A member 2b-like [Protopterus annectens]|uniref:dispanin subfamily A member 2b-like n=1 Tax=Protopterus annectens TaxID=7888 RepID=UPI001CF9399A|nr:dispanin subfamily A member 2b-like [Protopterus annectens]
MALYPTGCNDLEKLDSTAENVTEVPQEHMALCPKGSYDGLQEEGAIKGVTTTTVDMGPADPPPRDYIIWSLFTMMYLNICCMLGILPVAFSIKSRDRKNIGDMDGARQYGETAKYLNITALLLLLTIPVIVLIVIFTTK